ncbi:MAG: triose-phosphate isomerase [Rhizobacter sp.]|nr:triose-phosphate isomerase [Rhizobacter sp.]
MGRKLVVGNWKMNGSRRVNGDLLKALVAQLPLPCEVAVCVPFPYLCDAADALQGTAIALGAQDCSAKASGAYTGECAAAMLADVGASYVIVGHSERRAMHAESDKLVAEKALAALAAGVTPIVCVGETLQERDAGQTNDVVHRQLAAVIDALGADISKTVVAYEPVWAIGTGKVATPDQAQAVHAALRSQLQAVGPGAGIVKLLYGGSMKPDNAASLLGQADIDGGLIGGASLVAADFLAICRAAN